MTKTGTFYINENMRLNSKHFCLLMHKVDYDVLLLESKFCKPGREIYSKSGICSIVAEFDGQTLHIFYSDKTLWSNRLLQSWLRKWRSLKLPWQEIIPTNQISCIHGKERMECLLFHATVL